MLQTQSGVSDPEGTHRAWAISNSSAGTQALEQTLEVSGTYIACFSAYVKSDAAGTIVLQRDSIQATVPVGPSWNRVWVSGAGISGAAQSRAFSVTVAAGQAINDVGIAG